MGWLFGVYRSKNTNYFVHKFRNINWFEDVNSVEANRPLGMIRLNVPGFGSQPGEVLVFERL